jgi:hypothetical protein
MRKENLMNFLNSDDRFSFKVGDYLVPVLFRTCRKFIISLKENRSINLNQGKSKYVRYFEVLLKHFYRDKVYLKEVPLVIEKRKLWRKCCKRNLLKDEDTLNKNYFLADYVFPEYNLIVEIDSNLHNWRYDAARDEYVERIYGFKVLRFYEFGNNPDRMDKFLDYLDEHFATTPSNIVKLDYSDLIFKSFIYQIGDFSFKILNKIEKYLTNSGELTSRVCIVDSSILSRYELSILENLYSRRYIIIDYFKYTYNIDVFITTSNP